MRYLRLQRSQANRRRAEREAERNSLQAARPPQLPADGAERESPSSSQPPEGRRRRSN